ncbi:nucleoid-associated protein [Leptospira bouyouniensis]|uniref:Nucleoid-associated protein n=1 Tax=Leptospira bouyouniensis TaxID=2484911 RepID=A0ABY2LDL6_9LEPT|nr:nucleoid-associated protein [Leptospira bouyouniensis]TGK54256.1 hypothetical protein EHQ10_00380 [Leptospira bouyouniensis]
MQIKNLKIEKLIIHQIFQRTDKGDIQPPYISKKLTSLDKEGMEQFVSRIIEACGDNTHSAEMDIDKEDDSSAFQKSISLLFSSSSREFISGSEFLANKLTDAQSSRKYTGCILVVFKGTVGKENNGLIGLLKAEPQGGFTKKEEDNAIVLEYFKDLVLTPANKFYKLGLFIEKKNISKTSPYQKKDFVSLVYDHKLTAKETRLGARYFYETFLGCQFSPSDRKLTQDFYESTKSFINDNYIDDEERLDMLNSLYTYMKVDQSSVISISDFSKRYIEEDLKDVYLQKLISEKIPARSFNKDLSYISSKLKRRSMRFNTKVSISAPADKFDSLIQIEKSEENETTLKIQGKIEAIK